MGGTPRHGLHRRIPGGAKHAWDRTRCTTVLRPMSATTNREPPAQGRDRQGMGEARRRGRNALPATMAATAGQ